MAIAGSRVTVQQKMMFLIAESVKKVTVAMLMIFEKVIEIVSILIHLNSAFF